MQYFQAVQEGRTRASKSQKRLFDILGFAMLTLTTKKLQGKFLPVGQEDYAALIKTSDGYVVIIVDEDGYTKAQSKTVDHDEAVSMFDKVVSADIPTYSGDQVEIWTETYPVIHDR